MRKENLQLFCAKMSARHRLIISLLLFCGQTVLAWEHAKEIVVPILTSKNGPVRDAPEQLTLELNAFNKRTVIDLEKNRDHHLPTIPVRLYDESDGEVHEQYVPEDCYYHGKVRDSSSSHAAFSTCEGLSGSYEDQSGHYAVTSIKVDKVEVVRSDKSDPTLPRNIVKNPDSVPVDFPPSDCLEENNVEEEIVPQPNKRSMEILKNKLVDVQPQYRKFRHVNRTRYLEFVAVVDSFIYKKENNTKFILDRVVDTINHVDRQYSAINLRIVLTGVEIWKTNERINRSMDSGVDLGRFSDYCKKHIRGKFNYDIAHFLSHRGWKDYVVGLAYIPAPCGGTAVDYFNPRNTYNYGILSHELAHNLGMGHDGSTCKCLAKSGGCVMGAGGSCRYCGFSDCGMKQYERHGSWCLNNYPKVTFRPNCGNGIIDAGEECDCGSKENCRLKDPCCVPHKCILKSGYQCSDFSTPDCCSKCMFKEHGTMCRKSSGPCDYPEFCTGNTGTCPADAYARDYTHCSTKAHPTTAFWNFNTVDFISFEPKIEAKIIRIIPRKAFWLRRKHCIRVELLGCPLKRASAASPTPIATRDVRSAPSFCIVPNHKGCSTSKEGTLIYHRANHSDCSGPEFQFLHSSDGILRHNCSGHLVCPTKDLSRLIISAKCNPDNSKFRRTPEGLLYHVKTSMCVVERNRHPREGRQLILSSRCENNVNNILDFQVTDCLSPLGMENGKISNKAFTAHSVLKTQSHTYAPSDGRLWHKDGYCAETGSDAEYFQVELPKITKFGGLKIQTISHFIFIQYSTDGVHWNLYTGKSTDKDQKNYCYKGECVPTLDDQCKFLWEIRASKGAPTCWKTLNTNGSDYGTCNPLKKEPCSEKDIYCGQLQCKSHRNNPDVVKYGTDYGKVPVGGETCNVAKLKYGNPDSVGQGMVADGTSCGSGKICLKHSCKEVKDLKKKQCLFSNGKECGGSERGACLNNGQCYCFKGYEPSTGCKHLAQPIDGGLSAWGKWSPCTKPCNNGTKTRVRFCSSPYPKYGGKQCSEERKERQLCNTDACPVRRSCKELQALKTQEGNPYPSGVYSIKPADTIIQTYCDMKTSGGGWTLIVSSKTNTWTAENVFLRNPDKPSLLEDYSILKHADSIKNSYLIGESYFEYRLDAHNIGHNGGVWRAPRTYSFTSRSKGNTDIKVVEKYGDWKYGWHSVKPRMPYIYKQMVTTSDNPENDGYGTVTDNRTGAYPALWLHGKLVESRPEHIWYWMREGDYKMPKSCREIKLRGLNAIPYPSGIYSLAIDKQDSIKSYCDMSRFGGGWTLVLTSASGEGWTRRGVEKRNADKPSQAQDFSILEYANRMKGTDVSETTFQYLIEADGENQNGGIFDAEASVDLMTCTPKSGKPNLLKKFGSWDEKTSNLGARIPYVTQKNGIFVTTSSAEENDISGSLVFTKESKGIYLNSIKPNPKVIRMWIREGGRRASCNDYKLHAQQRGYSSFTDGIYMIKEQPPTMIPVYCDMTSNASAWTLLVTSRHNGWTPSEVLSRNEESPSLEQDYSILRWADKIKAAAHGLTFKYRIEARKRFHSGGIFEAPSYYTLIARNNSQWRVRMITQFGTHWTYDTYYGLKGRVPWLSNPKYQGVLLTTTNDNGNRYGSIVSSTTKYNPAPYIYGAWEPGVIWYWVNEDDCGQDRKAVDGAYGEWSTWSSCSVVCGKGKSSRQRVCNAPSPSCGGKVCDSSLATSEEKECTGECKGTEIRSSDGRFCILPQKGGCNITDETRIQWREGNQLCAMEEAKFVFDTDTGTIWHKCSGKRLCPRNMKIRNGVPIVLSDSCPKTMSLAKHFQRTQYGSVNINGQCIHPAGQIHEKQVSNLWGTCLREARYIWIFENYAQGPVKVDVFEQPKGKGEMVAKLTDDERYPNNPTKSGYIDNFDLPPNMMNHYGAVLSSFFVPPMTGLYTFYMACDDYCTFAISEDSSPGKAKVIMYQKGYSRRYQWNRYTNGQIAEIFLSKGKFYYIQGNLLEMSSADHFAIGVKLPSGRVFKPMTKQFLRGSLSGVPS